MAWARARDGAARGPLSGRTCLPKAGSKRDTILGASYHVDEYAVAALRSSTHAFKDQQLFFERRVKNRGERQWVGREGL